MKLRVALLFVSLVCEHEVQCRIGEETTGARDLRTYRRRKIEGAGCELVDTKGLCNMQSNCEWDSIAKICKDSSSTDCRAGTRKTCGEGQFASCAWDNKICKDSPATITLAIAICSTATRKTCGKGQFASCAWDRTRGCLPDDPVENGEGEETDEGTFNIMPVGDPIIIGVTDSGCQAADLSGVCTETGIPVKCEGCQYRNLCLARTAGHPASECSEIETQEEPEGDFMIPEIETQEELKGDFIIPDMPPMEQAGVAWSQCDTYPCSNYGYDEDKDCYPDCDSCESVKMCEWGGGTFCKRGAESGMEATCTFPSVTCDESTCVAEGGVCVDQHDETCGKKVCKATKYDGNLAEQVADCDMDLECKSNSDCPSGNCVMLYTMCRIGF